MRGALHTVADFCTPILHPLSFFWGKKNEKTQSNEKFFCNKKRNRGKWLFIWIRTKWSFIM